MPYELIICEKPSAAEKVAAALADAKPVKKINRKVPYYELTHGGKDIIVGAAVGHLFGLAEKKKSGWTYPVFEIEWQPTYESDKALAYVEPYVGTLRKLSKGAAHFTVACDYDVEGELIGWNVLRFICNRQEASRMKFSTLTKPDLVEAYERKMAHIDHGQALAGETRHKLDWFYGINLSRALTASIKAANAFKIMSIGRVQGPALKTIVDREREILAFRPVPFWQLLLHAEAQKQAIEALHVKDKFWDEQEATAVHEKVRKEKKAAVHELKRTEFSQQPPFPFDLTTLQTEAYAHLRINPKETLAIAQTLYLAGAISYPRTSSQQLDPKLGFPNILKQLAKQQDYGALCSDLLGRKQLKPNNGKKTDPAHPAIFPTGVAPKGLKERELKLYDLIVRRFLATFADAAQRESLQLTLDVKGELFVAEGKRTLVPGWHLFYRPYVNLKEVTLPALEKGAAVAVKKIEKLTKETQPPKRYTPSSIIRELEKRSLGTKATRADILDTLFRRGYASGQQIQATQLGMQADATLEKHVPEILDEALTRHFEDDMEKIREGKETGDKVLQEARSFLEKVLAKFRKQEQQIGAELLKAVQEAREEERTVGSCQACKEGTLRILRSKKTKKVFIGCDRYPACEATFPLPQNALVKPSEQQCGQCSYPMVMVIRKARRPQVLCINPGCASKKLEQEAEQQAAKLEAGKLEKVCPKCGKDLVLRRSFYGPFIGCSGYPACRHIERLGTPRAPANPAAETAKPAAKKEKKAKAPAAAKA